MSSKEFCIIGRETHKVDFAEFVSNGSVFWLADVNANPPIKSKLVGCIERIF